MHDERVPDRDSLVLVTGARGFIGRHAARHLSKLGCHVVGIGHGGWSSESSAAWGVREWRNGEVTHANLDALSASCGVPDVVVHLAGGSAVGPSFSQPAEDFRRSVLAAGELAEWMRLRAPHGRLVMASSAAVYGGGHSEPITESAVCRPYSPYGFHKRMAELTLESYARNFGLRVAVVRFFSVYGPGLMKQLLWDVCSRLSVQPRQLTLGGTGGELRDWLHVDDATRLLARAANAASAECTVLNGGTGTSTSVREIATELCQSWGTNGLPLVFSGQSRSGDPASLVADVSLAASIGWTSLRSWREGLAEYVEWFKSHREVAGT